MAGFALLTVSIIFMQEKGFPGWQAIIPIAASVLIIMAGKDAILNKYILSNKVLVWFGLISYPMYLWHWPLISMKRIVSLEAPSTMYSIGAFVACTVLAWLTTKLIENPLRFGGHGKVKTIGLFLVMVALGGTGYVIYAKDGLPKRFPDEIFKLQQLMALHFYDKNIGYKSPCYAEKEEDTDYKECRQLPENKILPDKKTIFIWGDSHAAHLVPGFRKYYTNEYNVQYRSMSGFAPILNYGPELIKRKNNFIFKEIIDTKPWLVIIVARWPGRPYKKLINTINLLKKRGINDIVIIGSTPRWISPLPKIVSRFWLEKHYFPNRLRKVEKNYFDSDMELNKLSGEWGINYISLSKMLCNKDGCMAMVDNSPEKILSFDEHHLTNYGSEYVVGKIKNESLLNSM